MTLHIETHVLEEYLIIRIARDFHISDVLRRVGLKSELLVVTDDKLDQARLVLCDEVYTLRQGFFPLEPELTVGSHHCSVLSIGGLPIIVAKPDSGVF